MQLNIKRMKFDFTTTYSFTFNAYLFIKIYSASITVPCRSDQILKNRMVGIDYTFSKSDKIRPLFNINMWRFQQYYFLNKMS